MLPVNSKNNVITCEFCKNEISNGAWVINSSEFGIFHDECYKEFLANEFSYDYGIWGKDITKEDL
ncbi:hypothetical protein COL28_20430 [Bacillus thuringiensis]|uniref:hypothetical protein n=1 Tax=Bacillus thuringiensis TaxID=1428 RepID=UPI000BF7C52D|nr:hypothetical protein [Bacillus thuringiensis]PFW41300.1 hypothetical protein COL28_20430 [Bacillus thuringiensis]